MSVPDLRHVDLILECQDAFELRARQRSCAALMVAVRTLRLDRQ